MQNPHSAQGRAVQKGQVEQSGPGQTSLRPQTVRLRRPDETHLQKEGQDHQKNSPEVVMHQVQEEKSYRRW